MPKSQKPVVASFPSLEERTLRYQKVWRTVALLADQAAHAMALYPNSITAQKFEQEFRNALEGAYTLNKEFWSLAEVRDSVIAHEEDLRAEAPAEWLKRNGVLSSK